MRAPFRAVVAGLAFASALSSLAVLGGCNTYSSDLERSQRAYDHADYERALAIFRELEPSVAGHFSLQEQAQYAYLRGMTDYRVGYKVDARHWLAIAHAIDSARVGLLPNDWKGKMKEALDEMNEQVYTAGIESLAESQEEAAKTAPAASGKAAPKAKPKAEDEP